VPSGPRGEDLSLQESLSRPDRIAAPPQGGQVVVVAAPERLEMERSPAFAAEAHRESLAVARSPHAKDDWAFDGAVSDRDAE